jgi:hypothetical protein
VSRAAARAAGPTGLVAVAVGWLLTRALCVWLLVAGPERFTDGDVRYYAESFRAMAHHGLGATLVEYPLPALGVLIVPWVVGRELGIVHDYVTLVLVLALLTDLAFLVLLERFGLRHRLSGLVVWILGIPLLGATAYARFDLVPGVLVGATVLLVARHPRMAGVCVALATGVKLWPGLVVPGLVAAARRRSPLVLAGAVTGAVLVVGSLAVAGWSRLVSPLAYQSERGLQIESLAATPAMVARLLHPHEWRVFYSVHHAYEIVGPGAGSLVAVSTVLTVGFGLLLLLAWWLVFRARERLTLEGLVWLTLAAVTGFMVTGRVLSPQYLLWVLPVAAAGVAVLEEGRRRLLPWVVVALVATGLTQLVFPLHYLALQTHTAGSAAAVSLLAARNVLLGVLTLWAWLQTSRVLREVRARQP